MDGMDSISLDILMALIIDRLPHLAEKSVYETLSRAGELVGIPINGDKALEFSSYIGELYEAVQRLPTPGISEKAE
jgi:hypothetical protein